MRRGLKLGWPVIMGYLPIGLAYGVIARQNGLGSAETVVMSVLVYAGSSQLMAAGMLGAGSSPGAVLATTFLVNSRHLLMSAALSPRLARVPRKWLPVLAFGITDESFALVTASQPEPWPVYGWLFFFTYLGWVGSSAAGALVGGLAGAALGRALEFALAAMFIGLLVPQVTRASRAAAALASALAALGLSRVFPGHAGLLAAILVGATVGLVMDR
ncbi:MAG: AzlC family ABC transporter permease [Bacillota bacterium]